MRGASSSVTCPQATCSAPPLAGGTTRAICSAWSRDSADQAAKAELAGDRLERLDHVRDVHVELEPEELRALVHVVAVDAGSERRLLQLLLDGLRLEPLEPGRANETAGVHEPRELVARKE